MSDAKADCAALKDLLMWCRESGMRMDAVTVGSVTVSVMDLKQGEKLARKAMTADPIPQGDALRRWGGPLLDEMAGVLDGESGALIEEDDEATT
jgi:hypothetical protein